jgi:hypothetical protein
VVDAEEVGVEGYNTGKRVGNDEPASRLDHAPGVHRRIVQSEVRDRFSPYDLLTPSGF